MSSFKSISISKISDENIQLTFTEMRAKMVDSPIKRKTMNEHPNCTPQIIQMDK